MSLRSIFNFVLKPRNDLDGSGKAESGSGDVRDIRDGTMEQHGPADADVDVDMDEKTPGLKSGEEQDVEKDGPPREDGAGAAEGGAGLAGEGGVVKEKLGEADSELPRLAVVTACEDGAVKVSIEIVPKLGDKEVPGLSEAADLSVVSGSPERSREQVCGSSDKVVAEEGPVLASGDGGGDKCGGGLLEQVTSVEGVAGPAPAKASSSGEEELHAVHIPGSDGLQGLKEELQKANSSGEAEVDLSNPVIDGKEKECKGGETTPPVLLKPEVAAMSDLPPALLKPEVAAMSDPPPALLKPEVAAMSDSDSDHAPITLRRTLKRTANRAVLVLQSDDEEKTSSDQDGSEHSSETIRYFEHEAEELTENFDSEAEEVTRFIDSEAEESDPHFGDDDEFPSDCEKPRDTDSEDEGVDLMDDFIDDEAEESLGESDSEEEPTEEFDRETDRSSQDEEDAADTDTMYAPDEDSAEEMEDDDQGDVEAALQQVEAATVRGDRLDDRKAGEQTVFPEARMDDAFSMGQDVQAIFDHEKRLHLLISRLLSSKAITADEADILRNYSRPRMVDASVETDFPQTQADSIGGTTVPSGAGVEDDVKKGPGVDSGDVTAVQTVQPASEQDVVDFAQKQCEIGGTVDKKRRSKVKDEQEAMLPPPGPVEEILEPKDLAEIVKKKKRTRRAHIVESESDDNEDRRGADECDTIQPAEEKALATDRLTKRKKGKRTGAERKPLEPSMDCDLTSDDEAGQADGRRNEMDPDLAVMEGEVQAKRDNRDGESDERGHENDEKGGESDERGGESDEKAVEKDEIRTSGRKKKRKTNVKQCDVAAPSDVEALVSEKVTKIKCDIGKMLRRSGELDQEGQPSEVEVDADSEKTSPQNNASDEQPAVGETATVGVELHTGELRKRKRKEKSENCDGEGLGDFLHGKPKRKHPKRNKLAGEHANLDVGMEKVHADSVSGLEKVELLNRAQEFSNDAARGKSKDRPKKKKPTGLDGSAELGIQDEGFVVSGLEMSVENHQGSERLVQMESSAVDLESELPLEISSKKQQVDEEVGASSFVKKQRGKKKKSRKAKVSFSYQVSGVVSVVAEHTELDDAVLCGNHPHSPSEPESATRGKMPSSKHAKKSKNGVQETARARPDTEKGNEKVGEEEMTLDSIWRSYMSPEWPGHALPAARPEKLPGNKRTMVMDTRAEVPQPQRIIIPYSPVKMKKRKAPSKVKHGGIRSSVSNIGLSTREDDVDSGDDRQAVGKKRKKKKPRTI